MGSSLTLSPNLSGVLHPTVQSMQAQKSFPFHSLHEGACMFTTVLMISDWHWAAAPLFPAGEPDAAKITGAVNLIKADFQV